MLLIDECQNATSEVIQDSFTLNSFLLARASSLGGYFETFDSETEEWSDLKCFPKDGF